MLGVLTKFLGTWKTRTVSKPTATRSKEIRTSGVATCARMLGGHFIRFEGRSAPPGDEDLQIMTYDRETGIYHQWFFDSDGTHHHRTGTWNEKTRTLLWKGETNGVRFVIDDKFPDDDTLVYTIIGKDKTGRVVLYIEGKVIRKK